MNTHKQGGLKMHCKDCRFYSIIDNVKFGFHHPEEEDRDGNAGRCSNEKFVFTPAYRSGYPLDGLGIWDMSYNAAYFGVGPDFGCVLFEPKE